MSKLIVLLVALAVVPLAEAADSAPAAPSFTNLGNYGRVARMQPAAAPYFRQGLILAYGFNHAEAARSFREALRLDPNCAICAWGVALVLGPNINSPMADADVAEANAMVRRARENAAGALPVEQALIAALATRYPPEPLADRSAYDLAYADAMRGVARRFPDDPDVQTLYAEAVLDTMPWNYWTPDGEQRPATREAVAALERAMAIKPDHPGALHLYIHSLEEYDPKRAEPAADRLRGLVPGAGHLVHMPGHIYLRVGRYTDTIDINIEAGEADAAYIRQCQVQGFYPLAYHPHNWHFVAAAATFAGNRQTAMMGAERTNHLMHGQPADDAAIGPFVQHFTLIPLYTAARFGDWDSVLAFESPADDLPYVAAIRAYARGMALAARGDLGAADTELTQLRAIVATGELAKVQISVRNNAQQVAAVAERVLTGNLLLRRGSVDAALTALREGVALEDKLGYNEPEDWNAPVRLALGDALLAAGKPAEAERAFREDLAKHPENGWALYGLAQSLTAQGKPADAEAVRARYAAAWRRADVTLPLSPPAGR